MQYDKDNGEIVWESTGRRRLAHLNILGINSEGQLFQGYDGTLLEWNLGEEEELTPKEKLELADYMIARWQRYKRQPIFQPPKRPGGWAPCPYCGEEPKLLAYTIECVTPTCPEKPWVDADSTLAGFAEWNRRFSPPEKP